mmetsp:Transcript_27472/g.60445  ORF Transcript_27472/g.60445 Transcript_27472/m.60445 type:complete len:509 (+) Transcript_27472:117-1643(+)
MDVVETAKDKFESRTLQQTLLRGSPEASRLIYQKAELRFMELVRDQYGNYLSQKVLEVATAEQFEGLFAQLRGELRDLANDVHGTRAVQKVVEQAIARDKLAEVLEALPGDLLEALSRSVTGFHVVVKLVEQLPAKEVEELLEKLCGTREKAVELGQDQWGCCVLKKCVDRAEGDMRQRVVDAIAESSLMLIQDPYGNYVVQHLLFMGHQRSSVNVTRVIDAMKGRIFELCLQKFSSNVLEKCLQHSSDRDRNKIINEILNPEGIPASKAVKKLLFHPFGNFVFQQSLAVAKDPQFSLLVEHSRASIQDAVRSMPQGDEGSAPALDLPEGSLASEHARRLALKLVKKYPALADGLEIEGAARPWGQYFDPYAANGFGAVDMGAWAPGLPGSPAYGYPMMGSAWDGGFGGFGGRGYMGGKRSGGRGGRGKGGCAGARPRSQGRRQGQPGEAGEGDGGSKQVGDAEAAPPVGRIVGFWPNYTITYDEVPAPGDGGKKSGRSKKARGKGPS